MIYNLKCRFCKTFHKKDLALLISYISWTRIWMANVFLYVHLNIHWDSRFLDSMILTCKDARFDSQAVAVCWMFSVGLSSSLHYIFQNLAEYSFSFSWYFSLECILYLHIFAIVWIFSHYVGEILIQILWIINIFFAS